MKQIIVMGGNARYTRSWTAPGTCVKLVFLLTLAAVGSSATYSYGQCPFNPEDAIPDTLDPLGYYPLEIGNEWHYETYSGVFPDDPIREEIVADTLIDGKTFYRLRETVFDRISGHARRVREWFLRIEEDHIQSYTDSMGIIPIDFSAPFNSCYEGDGHFWLDSVSVSGGYETSYIMTENTSSIEYTFPAQKTFESFTVGQEYVYGLGPTVGFGDFSRIELVYARIDGVEYGSAVTVSVNDHDVPSESTAEEFDLYPNPVKDHLYVALSGELSDDADLLVLDVLGRVVVRDSIFPGRQVYRIDTTVLAPGIYVLYLRHSEHRSISGTFAVVQ